MACLNQGSEADFQVRDMGHNWPSGNRPHPKVSFLSLLSAKAE